MCMLGRGHGAKTVPERLTGRAVGVDRADDRGLEAGPSEPVGDGRPGTCNLRQVANAIFDPRRTALQTGKQAAQTGLLPLRVRRTGQLGVAGLIRQEDRAGQAPHPSPALPRPTTGRRPLRHASRRNLQRTSTRCGQVRSSDRWSVLRPKSLTSGLKPLVVVRSRQRHSPGLGWTRCAHVRAPGQVLSHLPGQIEPPARNPRADGSRGGAAGCRPAPGRSVKADPMGTYFRPKARVMFCVTLLPSVSAALVRNVTNCAWAGASSWVFQPWAVRVRVVWCQVTPPS